MIKIIVWSGKEVGGGKTLTYPETMAMQALGFCPCPCNVDMTWEGDEASLLDSGQLLLLYQ